MSRGQAEEGGAQESERPWIGQSRNLAPAGSIGVYMDDNEQRTTETMALSTPEMRLLYMSMRRQPDTIRGPCDLSLPTTCSSPQRTHSWQTILGRPGHAELDKHGTRGEKRRSRVIFQILVQAVVRARVTVMFDCLYRCFHCLSSDSMFSFPYFFCL